MNTTQDIRFLGTSDEVSTCECCGRADLKSTVAISIDGGDAVYFGVVCAARAIGRKSAEVKSATAAADRAKTEAERLVRLERERAAQAPWFAFLAANGRGSDVFTRIKSLGGYATAKALFTAAQRVAA